MRVAGPPAVVASASGTSTAPAREVFSCSAYREATARERASGPARSSGRTDRSTTPPSPSRRPPTSSATAWAVNPGEATGSGARLELLNHFLRQIQRLVCGDDPAVRRADVENHRVVAGCADSLDHAVYLRLNRIEQ